MVSKKGTRRFGYKDNIFYWFVRRNQSGYIKIHILSEDKKVNLERDPIDSEYIVRPKDIEEILDKYFEAE